MAELVKGFVPQGGVHCITASLRQVFAYYGHSLSEAMLFGMGAGLDFTYINLAAAPMVSGRSKVMEFEAVLARHLGIAIQVKQPAAYERACTQAKKMIGRNEPVVVYVDMPMLPYLGMHQDSHFGGHSVVLFGYDDGREQFYVSDRDDAGYPIRTPTGMIGEDFHLVSYEEMQAARSSNHRPFPANNKYLTFDFANYKGINQENLAEAIRLACGKMLYPPAGLKGIRGMEKFAREIRKWGKLGTEKLRQAGVTNYFQISADGGTGGGIFRRLYGEFLLEAAQMLDCGGMRKVGDEFIQLSTRWDAVATQLWQLHETGDAAMLAPMSDTIFALAGEEEKLLQQLQTAIA